MSSSSSRLATPRSKSEAGGSKGSVSSSQRQSSTPSSQQHQPPTTGRKRKAQLPPQPEQEEAEQDVGDDHQQSEQIERILRNKVKECVRLALAMEWKRAPLKRDDIRRVMGGKESHISFTELFRRVQHELSQTFAMKLVAYPIRNKNQEPGAASFVAVEDTVKAAAFMLVSTLPIEARVELLFPWRSDCDTNSSTVLLIILSLIYVSGQTITEKELTGYLESIGVPCRGAGKQWLDSHLDTFIKQGYIYKPKGKELAGTAQPADGGEVVFLWGPRAVAEVPQDHIVTFVAEIYGNGGGAEGGHAAMSEAERARLRVDICRAAGLNVNAAVDRGAPV